MSITCEDLMELPHFQSIKLLAGHTGVHRTVTWPYVVTTPSVAEWLNSGELLFVINPRNYHQCSEWEFLQQIIIDCSRKRISGIVLVDSLSGHTIPQNILKLANDYSTPLYAMPWDLKLLNVTKEIINLIVSEQNIQKKKEIFIERLLFSASDTEEVLRDYAALHSIPVKNRHFIFRLAFSHTLLAEDNASVPETLSILKVVMDLNGNRFPLIMIPSGDGIIGFCTLDSQMQFSNAVDYITAIYKLLITKYAPKNYALAFGSSYQALKDMSLSFKEAKQVLYYISKVDPENHIACFDQLTLYRLFFDIRDRLPEAASVFVDRNLENLMEYDEKNGAELIHTLKYYLQNNCNLIKTADALYIHRNTLIYRLNLIKRTLNHDLDCSLTRMSLFFSILYYEFTMKEKGYDVE